jgi:branched-chain amino acid transport system substrate-binding protein
MPRTTGTPTTRTRGVAALALAALALTACGGGGDDTAAGGGGEGGGEPIKVGVLSDLSGATADVGTPYAEGIRGYADWVNSNGGLEGRQLELLANDYGYKVPNAEQLYSQYLSQEVVAVQGWGTGDTEALRQKVTQDELPFMSASYAETLVDPEETPYNFVVASTYSDQMRVALKQIAEQAGSERTEVAVFHHDSPFGLAPVADGEAYIEEQGYDMGYEPYPMPAGATDYAGILSQAKKQGAKYAVVQNVSGPGALLARNIEQQGLDMTVVCLVWCSDEGFITSAGPAAEGTIMVQPWAPPTVDAEGFAEINDYLESKGSSMEEEGLHYSQGWYTMHVMAEGLRKLVADGEEVTGPALKTALEELGAISTGGVSADVEFSEQTHRGMSSSGVYEVQGGKMVQVAESVEP